MKIKEKILSYLEKNLKEEKIIHENIFILNVDESDTNEKMWQQKGRKVFRT